MANITAEELALIRQQDYLKPSEAAVLTRKSKQTILNAIYSGDLEYLTHGSRYYITRDELDAWMRRLAGIEEVATRRRKVRSLDAG